MLHRRSKLLCSAVPKTLRWYDTGRASSRRCLDVRPRPSRPCSLLSGRLGSQWRHDIFPDRTSLPISALQDSAADLHRHHVVACRRLRHASSLQTSTTLPPAATRGRDTSHAASQIGIVVADVPIAGANMDVLRRRTACVDLSRTERMSWCSSSWLFSDDSSRAASS